jgi:hypothetical protein
MFTLRRGEKQTAGGECLTEGLGLVVMRLRLFELAHSDCTVNITECVPTFWAALWYAAAPPLSPVFTAMATAGQVPKTAAFIQFAPW